MPPTSAAASAKGRANRRRDTSPERALRSELHHRGLRFRVDHPVPTPARRIRADIAFARARIAVFVDGCFWHSCPEHGTMPKGNAAYWARKLTENIERDRRTNAALTEAGWTALRIWEHVPAEEAADMIEHALARGS
ncbi:MAG: very short patch repair endonuclease [Actinomycetota bacterium]|nr:very short patch repair endonuclease [Actinomycetota bacterium]